MFVYSCAQANKTAHKRLQKCLLSVYSEVCVCVCAVRSIVNCNLKNWPSTIEMQAF